MKTTDANPQDTQLENAFTGQRGLKVFLEVGKRRLQIPGWWHRLQTVYEILRCHAIVFERTMLQGDNWL